MNILLLNLPGMPEQNIVREECCVGYCDTVPLPAHLVNIAAFIQEIADVEIYDAQARGHDFNQVYLTLKKKKPDLVVVTITANFFSYEKAIVEVCRTLGIKCVVIANPFNYAEDFVKKLNPYFVIYHEPEQAIFEYVLKKSRNNVPGIMYKVGKKVKKNKQGSPRFHEIPAMNWDLLGDMTKYSWPIYQISRGCPYSCSFCSWAHDAYFLKKPEIVVKDVKELSKGWANLFRSIYFHRRSQPVRSG